MRIFKVHPIILIFAAVAALAVAAPLAAKDKKVYTVHPLVSDQVGAAPNFDPNLVNSWGLAASMSSPWWVADNGKDLSTLYTDAGAKQALEVSVSGGPTGLVFNKSSSFLVNGSPALFIFATEDGTIRAWNPTTGTTTMVEFTSPNGGVYKGLAIADTVSGPMLYAADFHNAAVDVFNGSWARVTMTGAFVDPKLPAGYAPFDIQAVDGRLFVTYAKQDAAGHDDVPGKGHGFVDVYDTAGQLLARVAMRDDLNSPWGIALAPSSFGRFGGDLLVGNFGDGRINAYEEKHGKFKHQGELRGADDKPITIDGLWALQFRPGGGTTLFFTAGPDGESHGLFGSITAG